ncbi:hypothetical protein BJ912DRAFT_1055891 [Pholiota molesta]|nr:hypothetical protein BJ912DRAFT_1055891 [Pholiota molesta]
MAADCARRYGPGCNLATLTWSTASIAALGLESRECATATVAVIAPSMTTYGLILVRRAQVTSSKRARIAQRAHPGERELMRSQWPAMETQERRAQVHSATRLQGVI